MAAQEPLEELGQVDQMEDLALRAVLGRLDQWVSLLKKSQRTLTLQQSQSLLQSFLAGRKPEMIVGLYKPSNWASYWQKKAKNEK